MSAELYISRTEMMTRLGVGEVASLEYCTLNLQRRTGGDRIELPEVQMLLPLEDYSEDHRTVGRSMTTIEQEAQTARKRPNHAEHYTRNFRLMIDGQPTGVIKKVHIRLIERFNGMNVLP